MSTTPNLLISLIATSQNNKEITANTAFDEFDEAQCANVVYVMTDANYVPASPAVLYAIMLIFQGSLSATRTVTFPTGSGHMWIVVNDTIGSPAQQDLIFEVGTAAQTITIADGNPHLLYSDGVGKVYKCS